MYHELIKIARESALKAAEYILSQYGKISGEDIVEKSENDFVTKVDKESENLIIDHIRKFFPSHEILAEESGKTKMGGDYTWIIDPLDGTKNFIKGIPAFAVSIGISRQSELVAGVIVDIVRGDIFHATKGGGAFKDKKQIHVSGQKQLGGSFYATGFPFRNKKLIPSYFNTMQILMEKSSGARRIGAAALDLCWVAQGSFDFFFERGLMPWDVAAGSIILSEAGGTISDFNGESKYLFGGEIIASNGMFHQELLNTIPKTFGNASSTL